MMTMACEPMIGRTWFTARLALVAVVALSGCGRAGHEPSDVTPRTPASVARPQHLKVPGVAAEAVERPETARLMRLRQLERSADLDGLAALAQDVAALPQDPELKLALATVWLAARRTGDAELAAHDVIVQTSGKRTSQALCATALRLWTLARLRQQKSLEDGDARVALERSPNPEVSAVRFWQKQLGPAATYVVSSHAQPAVMPLIKLPVPGDPSHQVDGIEAMVNGVHAPLVFIDTGAQHTVISERFATRARVEIGPGQSELVGFAGFTARPGVVRSLRVGSVVLKNVPVYIAARAPLEKAGGQAALGIDVMQHVRFTIDFPAGEVLAEPATRPLADGAFADAWRIPLWCSAPLALAQAKTNDGKFARVLLDTGNRSGSFASRRWLEQTSQAAQAVNKHLPVRFRPKPGALEDLDLAGRKLSGWRLEGLLPLDLERLDVVDILMGHDLLADYRVTIDLAGGAMYLAPGGGGIP